MAKAKEGKRKKPEGPSVSGYFRAIFEHSPKLLDSRSNQEMLQRWLADHPGEEEVPERIRQILSNVKSVLRQQGRRRGRRKQESETTANSVAVLRIRDSMGSMEALEEFIDEALTVAKIIDRDGLANVIQMLRRARNEVVWKMGQ